MTMTGDINGVPWYRCAEATRLFDAWVAMVNGDKPATFDAMLEYVNVSDDAWEAYQTHVRECEDCKKARREG